MYKPNFCSACGERIERARWHLWTSRRFCSDCAPRFRKAQFLLPIIACAIFFIVGLLAGRTIRPAPPPLLVERGELPAVATPVTKEKGKAAGAETESNAATPAPKPEPSYGPDGTSTERPTDASEVITMVIQQTSVTSNNNVLSATKRLKIFSMTGPRSAALAG